MPTRKLGVLVVVLFAVAGIGASPASAATPIPIPVSVGIGQLTVTDLFTYSATTLVGSLTIGGASYAGEFVIDGFSGPFAPPTALHGDSPFGHVGGVCRKRFLADFIDGTVVTATQGVLTGFEVFGCIGRVQGGRLAFFMVHLDVVKTAGPGSSTIEEVGVYRVIEY